MLILFSIDSRNRVKNHIKIICLFFSKETAANNTKRARTRKSWKMETSLETSLTIAASVDRDRDEIS